MERITYRKTLDVHKNGIQFTLQGFETADNMSRKIEISLMASGDTIDFPLDNLVAIMYVTTPNATEPSINECTIKDNKIIYDVLPIVEEGITEMQIKLIETRPEGAKGVLAAPRFAVEVTKSNTDDESVKQTTTYTALEDAIAKAKGVYDSRLLRIELDYDCMFRAYYADGTVYESDVLKELFLKGDALLSQSYARGGTGVRTGEDTDNSMYYSNVSLSASTEASAASEKSVDILEEVRKHGVYTAFSVDFETGEVIYISPSYSFKINEENGELEAIGEEYTASDTVEAVVTEWLNSKSATVNSIEEYAATLKNQIIPNLDERLTGAEKDIDDLSEIVADNETNVEGELTTIKNNVSLAGEAIEELKSQTDYLMSQETSVVDLYDDYKMIGFFNSYKTDDLFHIYGNYTFDCTGYEGDGIVTLHLYNCPLPYNLNIGDKGVEIGFVVPIRLSGDGIDETTGSSYGSAPIFINSNGDLKLILSNINGIDRVTFFINVMYPIVSREENT